MNILKCDIKSSNTRSNTSNAFMVEQTAVHIAAYVSRNAVPTADLPQAIRKIHAALLALQNDSARSPVSDPPTRSAIAASIGYNHLVSFIDGKAYKSPKRHLAAHEMTPSQYRGRYGLPSDYPMVSPGYARLHSRIAREAQTAFKAA